jgi:hypothetical protein
MVKLSTVVFHGNIKMTQSTQMFGKFFIHEQMKDIYFLYDRYTSSKDGQSVYASLLVWPNSTSEITLGAPVSSSSTTVTLLGSSGGPLNWRSAGASGGIIIDVSNIKIYSLASDWAWVFKLQNITPKQTDKKLRKY